MSCSQDSKMYNICKDPFQRRWYSQVLGIQHGHTILKTTILPIRLPNAFPHLFCKIPIGGPVSPVLPLADDSFLYGYPPGTQLYSCHPFTVVFFFKIFIVIQLRLYPFFPMALPCPAHPLMHVPRLDPGFQGPSWTHPSLALRTSLESLVNHLPDIKTIYSTYCTEVLSLNIYPTLFHFLMACFFFLNTFSPLWLAFQSSI